MLVVASLKGFLEILVVSGCFKVTFFLTRFLMVYGVLVFISGL